MSHIIYEEPKDDKHDSDLHQKIIDALPIPIFYRDTNGVYKNCNKAHEQFTGISKADLIGKTVYDVQPRELAEQYVRHDVELYESRGVQNYETKYQYADGSIHDVVFNKALITDDNGDVMGVVGSIFDVTHRKVAQRELEKAEEAKEIASIMLHKMRAGVVIVDKELKIIDANPSFAGFFGDELEELYEMIPGLRGADLKKVIPDMFIKMFTSTLSSGDSLQERDIRFQNKLLHVVVVTIYKHKVVGAIIRDMSAPVLQRTEIISRAKQVNQHNLDTVQKIAYLLGENAALTEELLNSIIESHQYGDQNE
ncbi:PAS domain S-box protein [Puteibacter caeruleilacunae]|nr:PAS domain S-box protein [Puteibacter caeruleilacunae]